jgi:hypothetical protein
MQTIIIQNSDTASTSKPSTARRVIDYLSMYLFIAMTSMPFFIGDEYLIVGFIISFGVFLYRKCTIDNFIISYGLIFFTIFMAQMLFFSVFEPNIILGYFLRIIYAYMTIKILGKKVVDYFINIIYFFSIISLAIFIPSFFFQEQIEGVLKQLSLVIEMFQLHDAGRSHVLIYTFGLQYDQFEGGPLNTLLRNSGPFWEPGGFGVFLIISSIFETIKNKKLLTKKNVVFIVSLLTTLSTTSFLTFFAFIVFYLITYPTVKRIFFLVVFVLSSLVIYSRAFFLNDKIEKQSQENVSLSYAPRTRIVSGKLDMIDFLNNPILGRGRFRATRFDTFERDDQIQLNHRNNGTTNMLVEFGLFGFVTFFYFMYKSYKQYCIENHYKPLFAMYAVILVLMLGFSQMIFIKPFFIGFSFFYLVSGNQSFLQRQKSRIS